MTNLANLRLYLTQPHPCSYLDGQEATTLFLDPKLKLDVSTYSKLSDMGFRRSGPNIYKPRCSNCQACLPSRIPVEAFKANRTQRKLLKRNQDLHCEVLSSIKHKAFYQLYERYINQRHQDGDMYPASREQYNSFLGNKGLDFTRYLAIYQGEQLLAVAVTDILEQGLSAIYTFFAPEAQYQQRSLGVYAVLKQIEWAQELKLEYLYLGYWIKNCNKMAYKTNYQPIEMLMNQQWLPVK